MYNSSKDNKIPFEFLCNKAKHVQLDALKMFVKKIWYAICIEKQGGIRPLKM